MLQRKNNTKKETATFLILLIVFSSGCLVVEDDNNISKEISIGIQTDISGFYPFMQVRDSNTLSVNINLYNSLVEIESGSIDYSASLAKSWINPNDTTWRFFLRENVVFHTGDQFTAEDVNYTYNFMKNNSFFSLQFSEISLVKIIDDYTIDFITKEPVPTFLDRILSFHILSKDYMESLTDYEDFMPVGTGAYEYGEYIAGEKIVLRQFKDYWKGSPEIQRVSFIIINSTLNPLDCMRNQTLEIIRISTDQIPFVESSSQAKVVSVQTPNVVYLGFDHRVNQSYSYADGQNPTANLSVRKAIYHALDIDSFINQTLSGGAFQQSQIITSHIFGFDPDIEALDYNLTVAKDLMKKAGYQEGFALGFLVVNTSFGQRFFDWIANQLLEINITLLPRYLDGYEYYFELYQKNTSFFLSSLNALNAESTIELLLHTTNYSGTIGLWNYGNYSNPEIDALYVEIKNEMDTETRKDLIQEVFVLSSDDVAYIPLYSTRLYYAVNSKIQWNPRPSSFIWVEEIGYTQF